MIYDCFTFFDELDLLELRLQILDPVVDRFVLCEAPFTFRGKPKPLYFAESQSRFARWNHKITALVYPGPVAGDPWANEWGQRDHLALGLRECDPDDLILLSDCDEIPDPARAAARPSSKRVLGHRHRYAVGYVNRIAPHPWVGTRALPWRNLGFFRTLRTLRMLSTEAIDVIDSGWHFSHLGGAAAIENKMKSFSHSEFDLPYYTDRRRIEVEFGSDLDVAFVPIDAGYPEPLRDGRYPQFVWNGPVITDPALSRALQHVHGCFAYVPQDARRVVAVSAEPDLWERVGKERFGPVFYGAVTTLHDDVAPYSWIVLDGFERMDAPTLAALRRGDLGVVAFVRNARSFAQFDELLGGKAVAPGRAVGITEIRAWAQHAQRTFASTDRLHDPNVYAPWTHMPEVVANVQLGTWARFAQAGRDALADFLARAFVVRLAPE